MTELTWNLRCVHDFQFVNLWVTADNPTMPS